MHQPTVVVTFPEDVDADNPIGHIFVDQFAPIRLEGIRCDRDSWTWYVGTKESGRSGPYPGIHPARRAVRDCFQRIYEVL